MRGWLGKEESMAEENKAVIRRLYEEVWNQHNPEAVDEFVAPDVFTRDMVIEHQHGIDGTSTWSGGCTPPSRLSVTT